MGGSESSSKYGNIDGQDWKSDSRSAARRRAMETLQKLHKNCKNYILRKCYSSLMALLNIVG